jgi:hypothetical protein
MHGHQGFLIPVILAATAALTPARTQTLPPSAEPPNGGTKSIASIPDLSGVWGRWFNFEPPSSGPGPIVSKLRRPDGTIIQSVVGDFTNPILRPHAAEVVKKNGELEQSGIVIPNPHNQCRPEPTPFALNIQLGMQIIQQKDEVTLLYLSDHQVRHVRMNTPHSAQPLPTWQGESVGHYEGGALVIDTIGQKVGPLAMVDRFGTPYSAALHVIERYRLIDGATARDLQLKHESAYFGAGKSSPAGSPYGRGDIDPDASKPGLQVEITVDDPAVFTTPWSAFATYRHAQGDWPEAVCAENTTGSGTSSATTSSSSACIFSRCLVPEADRPDF